jgi:hypothetical protein
MDRSRDNLTKVFTQFLRLVNKLSDDDLEAIRRGKLILSLIDKKSGAVRRKTAESGISAVTIERLTSNLRDLDSRKTGFELLDAAWKAKADLKQIAKHIDIPFNDRDNIATLREKIIEGTIGYRLRSIAIQGKADLSVSRRVK